jgi:glycosyltransferase involved in cell wall biosynthesis
MKYSIIIPARNEEMVIGNCLDCIKSNQAVSCKDIEVVVVLNRCTDGTEAIARNFGARIVKEDSKNLSRIRNKGAAQASGDIIVTIDADSCMSTNMLSEIAKMLATGRYIGGGVRILPERQSPGIRATMLLMNIGMFLTGLSGGLYWCRRRDFEAVGGFKESLFIAEDLDFARRLKAYGRRHKLKFTLLKNAHIVTSCRKFDRFGDWFALRLILFRGRQIVRGLQGKDHALADWLFYDFDR